MKKTLKTLVRCISLCLASVAACWLVACLQQEQESIPSEEERILSERMATRSLAETGMPGSFFDYADTARFGRLVPMLQRVDSLTPFVDKFSSTYGLPLWNSSWLEKGDGVRVCFVPVLSNDGTRRISTVWVFAETRDKVYYAPFRLADEPGRTEWRFLSDFMTYRVYGVDNELGLVLKKATPIQTRIANPYVFTTCNDIYTGWDGYLEYRYTDCFDTVIWVEEVEEYCRNPDPGGGSGALPGSGDGGGSSSDDSVIGGKGDNEDEQEKPEEPDEPKNPEDTPCGKAERLSLDTALVNKVQELFDEVQNYHVGDTEERWIKTDDGRYIYPSEKAVDKMKYNPEDLVGTTITEQYHSHPTGSCIPSWADLEVLTEYYKKGRIDAQHFSYGVISSMGCTSLVIINETKFREFAEKMPSKDLKDVYYKDKVLVPKTVEDALAQFIAFLNNVDSGVRVLFNSSAYDSDTDSMELSLWWPKNIDENKKLQDEFCR